MVPISARRAAATTLWPPTKAQPAISARFPGQRRTTCDQWSQEDGQPLRRLAPPHASEQVAGMARGRNAMAIWQALD